MERKFLIGFSAHRIGNEIAQTEVLIIARKVNMCQKFMV